MASARIDEHPGYHGRFGKGQVAFVAMMGAAVLLMFVLTSSPALAIVDVEVTATDPKAEAVLAKDQPLYVRIAYRSDQPVSLWARPYHRGMPVEDHRAGASARYTGAGFALGWFSLGAAGDVDEVRIFAGGGKPWREWQVAVHPVRVQVFGDSGDGSATEAWVQDLQEAARAARRLDQQEWQQVPTSAGDTTLLSGFALGVLVLLVGGLTAPFWAMRRWNGGWRLAAAVPAALMAVVVLRILVGIFADPTSHNLWPFEILSSGIVALGILASLAVARRFAAKAS